ncbi:MAG: hypothetical protein ACYDIA_07675 [Candidatus Humimicrobiaceae bacterium]
MEKIKKIFYGLTPIDHRIDSLFFGAKSIVQKIYDPPSYIIEILFLNILSCYDFGDFDKIHWHTYFIYRNVTFLLHDYKFGSCTLKYINDNPDNNDTAKELIHKIKNASKLIDKELSLYLKNEISKNNFFLKNSYYELISIYNFYNDKYKESKELLDNLKSGKPESIEGFTDFINKEMQIERECQYYMFSLVISFFSLSEFLLISILSFSKKDISYYEFMELSWSERFLKIFDIKSDKKIFQIYNHLLEIRGGYRNPLSHGLWSGYEQLLVPLKGYGLLPISYESMKKTMLFNSNMGIPEEKIINTFNIFFDYLNSDSWLKLIIKYLDFSFPIPFNKKEIDNIRVFMQDEDDFEKYLQDRAGYEDAVRNRDI